MGNKDFSWWYEIMKYTREAPGRVYADELVERIRASGDGTNESVEPDDVVNYLNTHKPEELMGRNYLRQDPVTQGVFSIPSQRSELDSAVASYFSDTEAPYLYNRYLYTDMPKNESAWSMKDIHHMGRKAGAVWLDDNDYLCIDLTRLPPNGNKGRNSSQQVSERPAGAWEDKDGCHPVLPHKFVKESLCVANFDLQELIDDYDGEKIAGIGEFKADGVIFTGTTSFAFKSNYEDSPPLKGGLCLRGATFCNDVVVKNVTFDLSGEGHKDAGYNTSKVDFRDVRFYGNVFFRDVRFMGDSPNAELSFEDARIQHESKDAGNKIEFNNVDFGDVRLNCFQMILGDYVYCLSEKSSESVYTPWDKRKNTIRFNNVLFGDGAGIDFTDAEIDNGIIEVSNVSALPLSFFALPLWSNRVILMLKKNIVPRVTT